MNLFKQNIVGDKNPERNGWYPTSKGNLFYFTESKMWSCRDDQVSDEYPMHWYEEVVPTPSPKADRNDLILNELLDKAMEFMKTKGYFYSYPVPGIYNMAEFVIWISTQKASDFSPIQKLGRPASRCCGRCDGVNDICIADSDCDEHNVRGCEKCWPHPEETEGKP